MNKHSARLFFICLALVGAGSILLAPAAQARVGVVSTWMGKLYTGDKSDANSAFLDTPLGFTADSSCNLYIADTQNHVIRKIDGTTNVITTLAGNGSYGLNNGLTKNANFRVPSDIAIGPDGELYVTDGDSTIVRRIKNGKVDTWITKLNKPMGITVDGTNIYVSDTNNNRIVKATTTSSITTVVTTGITSPKKLVVLGNDLYVVYGGGKSFGKVNLTTGVFTPLKTDFINADGLTAHNDLIYIVSGLHGVINEIYYYNPATGTYTEVKSRAENEWYNHGSDIEFCGTSMRLLFSGGSSVYQANEDGSNETKLAGLRRWNDVNGARNVAQVGRPWLLIKSPDGKYIYMLINEQIKQYNIKTGQLKYIAGGVADDYVDGASTIARLSGPTQMVISNGNTTLYFADRNNNRIRVFNLNTKMMSTLTGAGIVNAFNEQSNAYAEGIACPSTFEKGVAGCAYFNRPSGIALSKDGKTLYVSDSANHRIRTVNVKTGTTALLAGTGTAGLKNGAAATAKFKTPTSLLLSKNGKLLYVVEQGNHDVRVIDLAKKTVATLLGNGNAGFRDGKFSNARLSLPNYLVYGTDNNTLYLTEGGTLRVRQLNLKTKIVSTLAGSGKRGSVNGIASVATFANPRQAVLLNKTTLLVADHPNDMIRAISLK